ncbi:hypothetical protein BpHYR1_032277 [Brachionus plicatilis]|uniref:Uncharacterized protein n=1 Tax=Brachionus plicatilis TaxID=10195 RepID=A0A3M7Q665_BRAPC|nr:hypothetical protein BpHYR1_032277 [Brachionus plicatilis]
MISLELNQVSLINEIKGQSPNSSGTLSKFPEYFSFLTPLAPPLKIVKTTAVTYDREAIVTPDCHTEMHIRTTGYWMGVDYQGGTFTAPATNVQVLKADPYLSSLSNFNAKMSHTMSTH